MTNAKTRWNEYEDKNSKLIPAEHLDKEPKP